MSARRRWTLVGIGVVVVALIGVGLLLTLRNNARPVGIDEAKERTTTSDVTTTEVGQAPAARPDPGVYRYEGSGTEALSVPPLSQDQGPTMPATVEMVGDDCWTFRIDYSTNHWQQWKHCLQGDDLVEAGGDSWQRWMIGATALTNLTTAECDPGSMILPARREPDEVWTSRCVATNEAVEGQAVSEGPYRYEGEDEVDVGGTAVTTQHFVRERTMSGSQVGTERSEVWFTDEGLPVRNERTIEVRTDTVIGPSTYTETGEFHLVSLEPA